MTRPVENHPAWVLHVLANIDKHHALVTQVGTQESLNMRITISTVLGTDVYEVPPIRKKIFLDPERETEISRLTIVPESRLPKGWIKVQVDGEFKTRVWVERKWPLSLTSLGVVTWVRDDVVARCEPILNRL